jgi:2-polyprenyl-3-methyl-5-hydroxy-6-metoxy-1,4-benzoquinol methylase
MKTKITRENARAVLEEHGAMLTRISQSKVTANADEYSQGVRAHPYFDEMKELISAWTWERFPTGFRGIEIGAGGGNLTEALVKLPFETLIVTDLDEENQYVERLTAEFGHIKGVQFERRDICEPQPEDDFDVVFSCAVDHHVAFEDKPGFLSNVIAMLKPGGFYVSADVLVTPYDKESDSSRLDSVTFFHAVIVDEAIRKGKPGPARISYTAWLNELASCDEYKVSPNEYLDLAKMAGFLVGKDSLVKVGPKDEDVHGIYVAFLQRPI